MKLGDRMVDAEFLQRPNRYLAYVRLEGQEVEAHVPDPGRLPGLLNPGDRVRLIHKPGLKRKTQYTLALVRHGAIWVSVFPAFANTLVEDGLERRVFPALGEYTGFSREVKHGASRFDFALEYADESGFIEVKSVSLVEESVGKFPDAPTERGRKHLKELIELKNQGYRSVVLFVSQRPDTRQITCNDAIDPEFGEWLRKARDVGVELYGHNCRVTASAVSLDKPVDVVL